MRRLEKRNRAIFKEKRDAARCDERLSVGDDVDRAERKASLGKTTVRQIQEECEDRHDDI